MDKQFSKLRPSQSNQFHHDLIQLISCSYDYWFSTPIMRFLPVETELAECVYSTTEFALLAHNDSKQPRFIYANQAAQDLFELSWEGFISLESSSSASSQNREERAAVLEQTRQYGFHTNYSGERVSAKGKRFLIQNARLWNLLDTDTQAYIGQAALIPKWQFL